MPEELDPQHQEKRDLLRVVGPLVVAIGGIFMIVGMVDFFSAMGSFGPPKLFWCFFVGMPLLFVGGVMCSYAFMGSVSRYVAGEEVPVVKDVTNYVVAGAKDSIRDVAAAVGEGFRSGAAGTATAAPARRCAKCHADNEPSANFCKSCGAPLARTKPCPACGKLNAADARFCDHCGKAVG